MQKPEKDLKTNVQIDSSLQREVEREETSLKPFGEVYSPWAVKPSRVKI